MCPKGEQNNLSHHEATSSMKWMKDLNKIVMKCFFESNPWMLTKQREIEAFETIEQKKKWVAFRIRVEIAMEFNRGEPSEEKLDN